MTYVKTKDYTGGDEILEEWIDINLLVPYSLNSKIHSETQINELAGNIARVGQTNPIILDKDMIVIAGHGRLLALKKLKKTIAKVKIRTDLSKNAANALRLSDNRSVSNETDATLLSSELLAIDMTDMDVGIDLFMGLSEFNNLTMVLNNIDESAFSKSLNSDVDNQAAEAERDIESADMRVVPVINSLGFRVVSVSASRKIARFISSLQGQYTQDNPAIALEQFIDELESA